MKQQLLNKLVPLFPKLGLENIDPRQIRLRDKAGEDKLTFVMHDSFVLNRYVTFDGKEVAVQILSEVPE